MLRFIVSMTAIFWLQPGLAGETLRVTDLSFEQVLLHGSSKLEISQGEKAELILRGSASTLKKEPFFLEGKTLVLGRSKDSRHDSGSLKFKLTVVNLTHLLIHKGVTE